MTENKRSTAPASDDDAPDLSAPQWREKFQAAKVRRGRRPSAAPKISTTIRLDAQVVAAFRDDGPGWQSRINAALQEWLKRKKRSIKAQAKSKTRSRAA
ncbi:MAG: BrnA antitoxin family protein [Roseiarcus sp.]|jgi:uncharacterized protein (DUF4415 family)